MATGTNQPGATSTFGDGAGPYDTAADASLTERALGICGDVVGALQARPSILFAILAAIAGAMIGTWLASRFPPRPSPLARATDLASDAADRVSDFASTGSRWAAESGRQARRRGERLRSRAGDRGEGVGGQVKAGFALVPLGLRLLSNPIAQYYLRRTLTRQITRAFGR